MIIFWKVMGFIYYHFGHFGTIYAQLISRFLRVSGNLIRLRNCSKLVKGSLVAMMICYQERNLSLCVFYGVFWDGFHKKSRIKNCFFFIL